MIERPNYSKTEATNQSSNAIKWSGSITSNKRDWKFDLLGDLEGRTES